MSCLDRLEASVGAGGKDERNECQEHGEGGTHTTKPKGAPPLTTVSNYSR